MCLYRVIGKLLFNFKKYLKIAQSKIFDVLFEVYVGYTYLNEYVGRSMTILISFRFFQALQYKYYRTFSHSMLVLSASSVSLFWDFSILDNTTLDPFLHVHLSVPLSGICQELSIRKSFHMVEHLIGPQTDKARFLKSCVFSLVMP